MKVSELPYRRVTLEEIQAVMEGLPERIRNAKTADEILAAREDYRNLMMEYQSNAALAYMRYSINTVDEFYVAENEYYDEIGPAVQNYSVQYASALLDSPFRAELEEKLSPVLFRAMEVERKSMSPEIVEDMVEENKLVREYSDLMSGMEFTFRGETMPRALLMKYAKSEDRETRRECYEVLGKGLAEHQEQLDPHGPCPGPYGKEDGIPQLHRAGLSPDGQALLRRGKSPHFPGKHPAGCGSGGLPSAHGECKAPRRGKLHAL